MTSTLEPTLNSPPVARPLRAPLLVGGAFLAGCIVMRAVDPAGGPTICPFKAMTGLDCPGCGATRAVHQLLNGHVMAALDLNVFAVVLLPFAAWWCFAALVRGFGGPSWRAVTIPRAWLPLTIAVVVVFGVVRNLPMEPFHWLGTA